MLKLRQIEVQTVQGKPEDLQAIMVPTLVMLGDDDQIVPIANVALKSVKLLSNDPLKI